MKLSKGQKIFLITAGVLVALSVVKDLIIKEAAQVIGTKMLGAPVKIGRMSLSVLFREVQVFDLIIGNPKGFPREHLLIMPKMTAKINLKDALQSKLHFPLIVVDMKELVVIKNKEGKLNVDSLTIIEEAKKKEAELKAQGKRSTDPSAWDMAKQYDLQIAKLQLNVGKVIYKDFSKEDQGVVQAFDVDLKNKTIENIRSPEQLISSVLIEALKPTALRKAGMFAATTLLGVGFLPAVAVGVIVADDNAAKEIKLPVSRVLSECIKLSKEMGELKKEDKKKGQVFAKIHGCDIVFTIEKTGFRSCKLTIKARKHLLAKPQIAAGLLYQLIERLK